MPPCIHSSLLPRLTKALSVSCAVPVYPALAHSSISLRYAPLAGLGGRRRYATPRNTTSSSSLLSQALDQKQRRSEQDLRESIGPIPLGMGRPSINSGEKVKKWNELSTGGKFVRATARTTNLSVILLGAGLTAVLGYALISELFSNNSPTVLYGEACEKIKESPRVARYLHGPLKFHNNPPSVIRPRHRNQHVSSQIAVDSNGREHMFLTFYVEGSSSSPYSDNGSGYLSDLSDKATAVSEMSWDQVSEAVKGRAERAAESVKSAVRYLVGKPVPPVVGAQTDTLDKLDGQEEKKSWWGLTGMFSGLRSGGGSSASGGDEHSAMYTEGEVHAELIRNDDGYFVFRYLVVDVPNSSVRHPVRVFVERAPGVSEYEPVLRWGSR